MSYQHEIEIKVEVDRYPISGVSVTAMLRR